jgi:hypothetical protein
MPKYDYRCEQNGQTVEVSHSMNDVVSTWGDLCALAHIEPGETPADSPVHKIITGGFVATGAAPRPSAHACTAPACCSGGVCGLDN